MYIVVFNKIHPYISCIFQCAVKLRQWNRANIYILTEGKLGQIWRELATLIMFSQLGHAWPRSSSAWSVWDRMRMLTLLACSLAKGPGTPLLGQIWWRCIVLNQKNAGFLTHWLTRASNHSPAPSCGSLEIQRDMVAIWCTRGLYIMVSFLYSVADRHIQQSTMV